MHERVKTLEITEIFKNEYRYIWGKWLFNKVQENYYHILINLEVSIVGISGTFRKSVTLHY